MYVIYYFDDNLDENIYVGTVDSLIEAKALMDSKTNVIANDDYYENNETIITYRVFDTNTRLTTFYVAKAVHIFVIEELQ